MMVFDDIYRGKKEAISGNVRQCLDVMDKEIEAFLLFMLLVVQPLLKAVTYIQKDQSIPIEGSKEFQFLAKEYNIMHQTNLEQKKELAYEATHDNLTGIYNRNGYDSIQPSVDWDSCALVLFDLDHFKPVNDIYGHKMGDQVLARAARVIQNAFRAQDFVCRIGGDEFAVIMVQVNTDSGNRIVEKVRKINEELKQPKGDIPGIQVSCGVAYGALISDFDRLFHEADAALYRVKRNGGSDCEICN